MRLAEPSICCAVHLQMVALKVKKKGTSKADYCQIAETPTAEAGPKHQRALLDSISGDISNQYDVKDSKLLRLFRAWNSLTQQRVNFTL